MPSQLLKHPCKRTRRTKEHNCILPRDKLSSYPSKQEELEANGSKSNSNGSQKVIRCLMNFSSLSKKNHQELPLKMPAQLSTASSTHRLVGTSQPSKVNKRYLMPYLPTSRPSWPLPLASHFQSQNCTGEHARWLKKKDMVLTVSQ